MAYFAKRYTACPSGAPRWVFLKVVLSGNWEYLKTAMLAVYIAGWSARSEEIVFTGVVAYEGGYRTRCWMQHWQVRGAPGTAV